MFILRYTVITSNTRFIKKTWAKRQKTQQTRTWFRLEDNKKGFGKNKLPHQYEINEDHNKLLWDQLIIACCKSKAFPSLSSIFVYLIQSFLVILNSIWASCVFLDNQHTVATQSKVIIRTLTIVLLLPIFSISSVQRRPCLLLQQSHTQNT